MVSTDNGALDGMLIRFSQCGDYWGSAVTLELRGGFCGGAFLYDGDSQALPKFLRRWLSNNAGATVLVALEECKGPYDDNSRTKRRA